ncbi:HEAT repeat domain-containing protein [candidate division KSB1 bacterium]|nr:HEAT repeat domain-containing protein [candidate division KSB1 bacterium]
MKQARILKIVVASPGDVQAERDAIPAIVDELNKGIAEERSVRLEVYRWETDAYPAFHPLGPQGQIDSCLRIDDCDLLVAIFGKRFGTPVLDANSGTEHEIRVALEACEKMGRPQLMLYFNQAPHNPQSQLEKEQWQQVLDFKQSLSQKVLRWDYNGRDEFPKHVREHLTKFIRGDYSGRPLDELLQAYRGHLNRRVSTVRIFGEAEARPLEKVFVELTLTEAYERPTANAQWLGMMDAELRRRRDIFARDDEAREGDSSEKERKKEKRTLKPDELLRRRTQAVIVGAPGCGKTTLLRYLSLKTLQAGKRFPVFLELKSLSEKAFEEADGNLIELLFAKAITAPLGFSPAETERCKANFLTRLKAGEVTIFLDGLDEVAGAKFFNALCRSVNDFMASAYRHNDLIISTRPYALQQRFEGLQEMEIASLNPRQIEAFLQHYYGDDPTTKKLQQELRRRRELQEMARVPFLLNVIAYLYRQQGEIVGERLELYRQLVQQFVTQLDREKNVERFYLLDPDGSLKRDFLKQLAYDRLFVDEVEKDAERLIMTGEVIAAKARAFCQIHLATNPHLLAADVKATPLLREIGADAYAFSHLTLQEYLAAVALTEQTDCEMIFCRAYFNPPLAEMEVLPMALGLVRRPDDFCAALEGLPESLNFTNLRLRARGLAYVRQINPSYLGKLMDRLISFIAASKHDEKYYSEPVSNSFAKASGGPLIFITDHFLTLLESEDGDVRMYAVEMLGKIGSERVVEPLLHALKDDDHDVRWYVALSLGKIGGEHIVDALLGILQDEDDDLRNSAVNMLGDIGCERSIDALLLALKSENLRANAANALGEIKSERGVEALSLILKDKDSFVRCCAAEALGEIGSEVGVDSLMLSLKDEDWDVRQCAAKALGKIGCETSVDSLLLALQDEDDNLRGSAAIALGEVGDERGVDTLLLALKDKEPVVRWNAAEALGKIGSEHNVDSLCLALKDEDWLVRKIAAEALGEIGSENGVDTLLLALEDENNDVRMSVADALGKIGNARSVEALLPVLKDKNCEVREHAANSLGEIGDERSLDALLLALQDEHPIVRDSAAVAIGKIGSERGYDALLRALRDEVFVVRMGAAEALGKIGRERSVSALLLAWTDEDKYVRETAAETLGIMNHTAIAMGLTCALFYDNSFARQKAAQAIGYYTTDKQVLATLRYMADNDPAEEVRTAAREAAEKYANKLRYFASKE